MNKRRKGLSNKGSAGLAAAAVAAAAAAAAAVVRRRMERYCRGMNSTQEQSQEWFPWWGKAQYRCMC